MSGITFIYNLCDVDVFVSINGSSPQCITAAQSHPSNATHPHRLHYAAVPQTRNRMPFNSWEFGIDTEIVENSLQYHIGSLDEEPIDIELAMSLLKHPNQGGLLQIPLESDSRIYLHPRGIMVWAGGNCTEVIPKHINPSEEEAC